MRSRRSGLTHMVNAVSFFILVFSFSANSYGQTAASGGDGIYFSLGAKMLKGEVGTDNDLSVKSRDMLVYGAEAVLGYHFSNLILGVGADYNVWQQTTDASEVSNTNASGNQMQIAGVVGYRFNPLVFIGKYYFSSEYEYKKSNALGSKSKYSEPASRFALQVLYNVSGGSHLGVEYTSGQYEKVAVGSIESTLTGSNKLNADAIGVVYVWIY